MNNLGITHRLNSIEAHVSLARQDLEEGTYKQKDVANRLLYIAEQANRLAGSILVDLIEENK